jgi:hypothetical protein
MCFICVSSANLIPGDSPKILVYIKVSLVGLSCSEVLIFKLPMREHISGIIKCCRLALVIEERDTHADGEDEGVLAIVNSKLRRVTNGKHFQWLS